MSSRVLPPSSSALTKASTTKFCPQAFLILRQISSGNFARFSIPPPYWSVRRFVMADRNRPGVWNRYAMWRVQASKPSDFRRTACSTKLSMISSSIAWVNSLLVSALEFKISSTLGPLSGRPPDTSYPSNCRQPKFIQDFEP